MQRIPNALHILFSRIRSARPAVWIGLGGLVVLGGIVTVVCRTQLGIKVAVANKQSVLVNGPLTVKFNQDLAGGGRYQIEPNVPGSWSEERSVLGVTAISFTPSKRFEAGRNYTLKVAGLKRTLTGGTVPDITETFTAQIPPAVSKASPEAGAKNVPVRPQFSITLLEPNRGVRALKPVLTPAVEMKLVSSDDRTFVWEPVSDLTQGAGYLFALQDLRLTDPAAHPILERSFTVVGQPAIVSARTGGYFMPGQSVDIVFDQPMEPNKAAFTFDLAGEGVWADDKTFKFTPKTVKPGETHNYVVKGGLKSKAGGKLEGDRPYSFATTGAVSAIISPGGSSVGLASPITVAFDQAVDHASAQAKFSIAPAVAGAFSWSGNTMKYAPTATMAYQTTYNVSVAPGVAPTWGLPNPKVLGASFATEPQTIKLGVPASKNSYRMSCELNALKMLLAYRGIGTTEWDILMKVGYNPSSRDTATNSWGDPNQSYVGDIGGYPNKTGYGVHAGPIAAAARTYGKQAEARFNVSPQYIAGQVHGGNPVAFWGHSTPSKPDAWNTPNGVVNTWLSSHARVIYGVVGSAQNPIGFHIIETTSGKTMYWTTGQLMANMNIVPGVSNQTVVVF